MAWALPLAWLVLGLVAATSTAPPARRLGARRRRPGGPSVAVGRAVVAVGVRLGLVRARPDEAATRRLGRHIGVVVALVAVAPPVGLATGAIAALAAWWQPRRRAGRLAMARAMALPELVDTLRLATAAGLTLPLALPVVAHWGPPELRADLRDATDRVHRGATVESALETLRKRWGAVADPLIAGLVDHSRYGTPLLPTLERVGDETRRIRRQTGESRIRRLPVTLLFPLVLCTLPAFGLLTVGPLLAGSLLSLVDGGLEAPASFSEDDIPKVETNP